MEFRQKIAYVSKLGRIGCCPYILYLYAKNGCSRKRSIGCKKGRLVEVGRGHIKGVVSADIMSVSPRFPDQFCMRNTIYLPSHKVFQRQRRTLFLKLLVQHGAPQDRKNLDVEECRCDQQSLPYNLGNILTHLCPQQILDGRRGVDDIARHLSS